MIVKLLVEGGNMKPGPAISQKLGPLGMNLGKIIQDINKETQEFKGLKVPVELDINTKTKKYEIKVSSPPVSELIKKELNLEKGSGEQKKIKVGNISIEQIIKITKTKLSGMLASDLKSAVKNVVGSCVSLGILIDSKDPKHVEQEIDSGKYDNEIKGEKTEPDEIKRKKLQADFEEVKAKQEQMIKKEAEEKAAEEAKKTEVAGEEKPGEEKKTSEKKAELPAEKAKPATAKSKPVAVKAK